MQNEYKNLTEWCAEYSKRLGIKIYPQSAPLQLVMEDMLERFKTLESRIDSNKDYNENMIAIYNSLNQRVTKLEEELVETNKMMLEATTYINELLPKAETKKVKK